MNYSLANYERIFECLGPETFDLIKDEIEKCTWLTLKQKKEIHTLLNEYYSDD